MCTHLNNSYLFKIINTNSVIYWGNVKYFYKNVAKENPFYKKVKIPQRVHLWLTFLHVLLFHI